MFKAFAALSGAVMLWWMAVVVVDYLARIAENTMPRAQASVSTPPPRASSGGSSGSGHANHNTMESRVKSHDDPATDTATGAKAADANTRVLD